MADNWLVDIFNVLGKIQEIKKANIEIKALKKSAKVEREILGINRDVKQLNVLAVIIAILALGCGFIQIIIAIFQLLRDSN